MSTTSRRVINISYSGDLNGTEFPFGATNPTSPVQAELMFFAAGDNTLDVPLDAVALTLVPPASNAAVLTLKGSSGDTGIVLHATHPSSIAIDPLAPIILNVDIDVEGVRLIWT